MSDDSTDAPKCGALTKAGAPCRTYARPGQSTCYSHATDIAPEVKRAARARGGHATAHAKGHTPTAPDTPSVSADALELVAEVQRASSPGEIAASLTKVYAAVLRGAVPARVGAVCAQLANAAIKAFQADVSARLKRLEKKLDQHPELRRAWDGEC